MTVARGGLCCSVRVAVHTEAVALPIGVARRATFTAGVGSGASNSIIYFVRIDEQTTLVVGGLGSATDEAFLADAIDHVVGSLRRP